MTTIEDVIEDWQKDVIIDSSDLGTEALKIPLLHGKWLKQYSQQRLKLRSLKVKQKQLQRMLTDYYRGDLNNPQDLKEIGREPYPKSILRQELSSYVEADSDMVELQLRISYQSELVDVLEEIVKSVNVRGFVIKNALDWARFTNGL